jgi:hypothetical protein
MTKFMNAPDAKVLLDIFDELGRYVLKISSLRITKNQYCMIGEYYA